MSNTIYCTYATFVSSRNLPPLYIGSTSLNNIKNGYHGSVSNKEFKEIWKYELKNNPQNFKTILLSIHFTREEAYEEEERLQRQYKVAESKIFANKSYQTSTGFTQAGLKGELSPLYGKKKSKTHLENFSKARKGKKQPNITIALTGKKQTEEHKKKGADARRGQTRGKYKPETKPRASKGVPRPQTSERLKGKSLPQKRIICPHCGKEGGNIMKVYHFDNCKFKNIINKE